MTCGKKPGQMTEEEKHEHGIPVKTPKKPAPVPVGAGAK